jgi:crotonobetaine/carnitine-CoA ligase
MTELYTLPAWLRRRSENQPDLEAIRHVDGRSMTNAQYAEAAAARARALIEVGVREGDNVASYLQDKIESSINWPGVAWTGAVEVPINPQLFGDPLVHCLNDSQARFVVTTSDHLADIARVRDQLTELESVILLDAPYVEAIDGLSIVSLPSPEEVGCSLGGLRDPELWDPACIIYTSGTTGPPKGVIVPWGQPAHTLVSPLIVPIDRSGPRYSYTPHYHMSGKGSLLTALGMGDPEVLRDSFSLTNFWSDVKKHGCTHIQLFPQLISLLLREPEDPSDLENPVHLMVSMPATPDIDEFKRRFGIKRVCTGYGMTEIGGALIERDVDSRHWNVAGRVPEGPPGIQVKIVDEHDREVERGEVGALIVRHYQPWAINMGYYNRAEATAEAWQNGWFHTGDAMRQDDQGYYYFVDRLKDCIRCKGENVSSFEIEKFVVAHPSITETAAIGVPAELGEEEIKIVVVPSAGSVEDPEELYAHLESVMPKHMLPRYIDYVQELPKTPATGRIRKVALKTSGYVSTRSWDREERADTNPKVGTRPRQDTNTSGHKRG